MMKEIKLPEQTINDLQDHLYEIFLSSRAAINNAESAIYQARAMCNILQEITGKDFDLWEYVDAGLVDPFEGTDYIGDE